MYLKKREKKERQKKKVTQNMKSEVISRCVM